MSNKRIGCENFGKFYTEGKVRNRREWRGVTDTLYDYSRWLHNWITMAKMVSKPRNIKAMFRYRWMANYLAVPMMVDRHTQGLRDEYLRICHLEQDLIIEDVAKLLDGLFRGDRRIGKDKKFSDKVVLVDENEMTAVMMGFPTLKGLSRETPSTYVSVLLNQHAAEHYIDVAQEYGLAGDVCPMPEAEAGVSIDDDAPVLGACAVQCNTTCDGSLLGNGVISKRLELEDGIPVFQLSRYAAYALQEGKKAAVYINFLPGFTDEAEDPRECALRLYRQRQQRLAGRKMESFFTGLLHQKLGQLLLRMASVRPELPVAELSEKQLRSLASLSVRFKAECVEMNGFLQAQVVAGGVDTTEIDSSTMASRLVPGLYFAGEVLDIDGICGGYNLQWAWASGFVAGRHAAG